MVIKDNGFQSCVGYISVKMKGSFKAVRGCLNCSLQAEQSRFIISTDSRRNDNQSSLESSKLLCSNPISG